MGLVSKHDSDHSAVVPSLGADDRVPLIGCACEVDICKLGAVGECGIADDLGCYVEVEVLNRGNCEAHENHIGISCRAEVVAVLALVVGKLGASVEAGCGDLGNCITESYGNETVAVLECVVSDDLGSCVHGAGLNVEVDRTNENEILVSIVSEVKSAALFGVFDNVTAVESVLVDIGS